MADYGITDKGIKIPTYADLDENLRQAAEREFRVVLGQNTSWTLNWDNTNPITVFYRVLESELYRLWNLAETIYYAGNPYTATGDALDLLVTEHGITRRPPAKAKGIVTLRSLGVGQTVKSGTKLVATNGVEFVLLEDVFIPNSGRVDVWVEAVEPGTKGNVGPGAITTVSGAYKDVAVDSMFHEAILSTGWVANAFLEVPPGGVGYYQIVRAADIEHPLYIAEVRLWVANETGEFDPKKYRLAVALVDDVSGREIHRSGEVTVVLNRHEQTQVRWPGLSWSIGYEFERLRLVVLNSAESDGPIHFLGNTMNPYPGCYWYAEGVEQQGTAALFEIVSQRPGGTWGGEEGESDAELRWRYLQTKASGAAGHLEAIKAAVWRIPGVRAVNAYQNREDVEVDDLPPHSVRVVVEGGDTREIAYALFRSVPAGIRTVGAHAAEVTDRYGQKHIVHFDRPQLAQIVVSVRVIRNNKFTVNTPGVIRDAVVAAIGGYTSDGQYHTNGIGATISYAKVAQAVLEVEGVADIDDLLIGRKGGELGRSNIELSPDEIAVCAVEDVEVTWL